MELGNVASNVGKGLFAGFLGTAVMTASTMIEMKLRNRPASTTPADAVSTVLEIEPQDAQAKQRLSNLVHWSYGTSWGAVHGLVESTGVRGGRAMLLHFMGVWGTALVMLPALKVAPPLQQWGDEEIAVDGFHHLVYAAATAFAYGLLSEGASGE